jgi:uncharacterized phage protein gp47/JayE
MRLLPPTYEQILQQFLSRMVTLAGLSDVSDTSVLRHTGAAIARAVDQANYQTLALLDRFSIDTAQGADLDARAAEIQPGTISRFLATTAAGHVIFTRAAQSGTVGIPAGTQVSDSLGNVFATQTNGLITPVSSAQISGHLVGQDSSLVPIKAVLAGSAGNVADGTITTFVQRPTGIDSVINVGATSQGTDEESDTSFRARIKAYVASLPRSTPLALQTAVLGQTDPVSGDQILFAQVSEDVTTPGYVRLYIDDGTGTSESVATVANEIVTGTLSGPPTGSAVGGESRLNLDQYPVKAADAVTLNSNARGALAQGTDYTLHAPSGLLVFTPALIKGEVITASYTYFTGIIALAQKIVDGSQADPTNYPGIRAAGISVTCLAPLVIAVPISVTCTVEDGYDAASTHTAVQSAILSYVNALPISGDILLAGLFQAIMAQQGISNTTITTPAADMPVGDGSIARILASNVTVN